MMKSFAEHLRQSKARAMKSVERGDLSTAISTMLADLRAHPETKLVSAYFSTFGRLAVRKGEKAVRALITDFVE